MSRPANIRRIARATAPILLLSAVLSGCGTHLIDARTLARGCAFGGGTPEEDAACAERNFGSGGTLYAINDQAKRAVRGKENSCKEHVAAVAQRRPGTQGLYTTVAGVHHVSAVVDGHILDNGALGIPGDVMTLERFRAWYGADFEIAGLPDLNPDWNVTQLRLLAKGN